jgi:hypothetical protein
VTDPGSSRPAGASGTEHHLGGTGLPEQPGHDHEGRQGRQGREVTGRQRQILLVVLAGVFMVVLDTTIVNVALPSLASERTRPPRTWNGSFPATR